MVKMYGAFDSEHKFIIQNQVEAKNKGLPEVEVDVAWDGTIWEKGCAPSKPQEVKEQEVRTIRNDYLKKYIDDRAKSPFMWDEVSDEEKEVLQAYRKYLMDYPETAEDWFEHNPKTLEEWKV
jgi:hypothetical protein